MKTANQMIENVKQRKAQYEVAKARRVKILSAIGGACVAAAVILTAWGFFGKKTVVPQSKPQIGNTPATQVAEPQKPPVSDNITAAGYKVLLDVNPSIELGVSAEGKITEVSHRNEDGALIIGDNALAGMEVKDGVGTLVGEMADKGYISKEANTVLVSIEGAENADQIKAELAETITDKLADREVEGSVIVQDIPGNDPNLENTATQYGISPGKAQLIAQIIAQNSLHTYDELAKLSIHELNVLRQSYYVNQDKVEVSGQPSLLTYIGAERAMEIATEKAGITADAKAELTYHAGMMIYCVEFETETHEYRYRINAVTGEIVTEEKVEIGKENFFQGDKPVATVGENAALNAALAHAGMENSKLIRCKCKSDWVDGTVIYDLYFTDGKRSGTYVVNARTGEILKYKVIEERHDRSVSAAIIGEAKAKQIALAKDGLVDGNVSKYEMNLKKVDDGYVYDLNYICNGVRYIVQVAADDGEILSYEKIVLKETGAPSVETGDKKPAEG